MARYRLEFVPEARSEFLRLPPKAREAAEWAIERLLDNPYGSGPGFQVGQLRSAPGVWAMKWSVGRHGFRAAYGVVGAAVIFAAFGSRPGFYTRLPRVLERLRRR